MHGVTRAGNYGADAPRNDRVEQKVAVRPFFSTPGTENISMARTNASAIDFLSMAQTNAYYHRNLSPVPPCLTSPSKGPDITQIASKTHAEPLQFHQTKTTRLLRTVAKIDIQVVRVINTWRPAQNPLPTRKISNYVYKTMALLNPASNPAYTLRRRCSSPPTSLSASQYLMFLSCVF